MQFSRSVSAVGNALNVSSAVVLPHQPFCHDAEGWGPLSVFRYDFTPCFADVPQAAVALAGIIAGAATIWWLLNKQSKQPTEKDWHYFTKLVRNETPHG
jgi:hypothetical protein